MNSIFKQKYDDFFLDYKDLQSFLKDGYNDFSY